jgi:hypothetical protein
MQKFDCILIPGGGFLEDGSLPPWTIARLNYAVSVKDECRWFILLSGGTVHKPPPVNADGFPLFESSELAKHLVNAGINSNRILTEISSYDTIGNAHFARLLFTEPLQLKNLLIVTSEFHMPRTKAIFEWVFHLPPLPFKYQLDFESTPNEGLSSQALAARIQREEISLENLRDTIQKITNLDNFITWLYTEHTAYATNKPSKPVSDDELKSY